jgi:hypothetical protein
MSEIIIFNWKYSHYKEGEKLRFKIEPDIKRELPSTLCKYYSLSSYTIEAIKNRCFYASQPDNFNDIFDAHFHLLNFKDLRKDVALKFIEPAGELAVANLHELWEQGKPDVLIEFIHHLYYSLLLTKTGIVCTTPNKFDELMWGYYNNHQGFLIEFDYTLFPDNFHGPFPVNYVDKIEAVDINTIGAKLAFIVQSTIKKKKWLHESEFRFLVEAPIGKGFKVSGPFSNLYLENPFIDRFVFYPKKSVVGILIGYRFISSEEIGEKKVIGNKTEIIIKFISEKRELKAALFDYIIEENVPCHAVVKDISCFELTQEEWVITKEDEFVYKVVF